MSFRLTLGFIFESNYTVQLRSTVPQIYYDTLFCRNMSDVIDPAEFNAKIAAKKEPSAYEHHE